MGYLGNEINRQFAGRLKII